MAKFDEKGFRIANCPMCFRNLQITSLEGDTRWRFPTHTVKEDTSSPRCNYSGELVSHSYQSPASSTSEGF